MSTALAVSAEVFQPQVKDFPMMKEQVQVVQAVLVMVEVQATVVEAEIRMTEE